MSIVTPRAPLTPHRVGTHRERPTVLEAARLKARGVHLELAVASGRGTCHAVNEDSSSALDRSSPVYVVADGRRDMQTLLSQRLLSS